MAAENIRYGVEIIIVQYTNGVKTATGKTFDSLEKARRAVAELNSRTHNQAERQNILDSNNNCIDMRAISEYMKDKSAICLHSECSSCDYAGRCDKSKSTVMEDGINAIWWLSQNKKDEVAK